MILKKLSTYDFDEGVDISFLQETDDYLFVLQNPRVESSGQTIAVFDKTLKHVKTIALRDAVVEGILVKKEGNSIAVVCPRDGIMMIINLDNGMQRELTIPYISEDDEAGLYPSALYYWQNDELIMYTAYEKIYRINMQTSAVSEIQLQDIQKQQPLLYAYLLEAKKYPGVSYNIVNATPQEYQFAFRDGNHKMIGFFDLQKNIRYTVPYAGDDIHGIYFYKNHLIVVGCHAIEAVNKQGIQNIYTNSKDREMRDAIFISSMESIVVLDLYQNEDGSLCMSMNQFIIQ